MATIRIPDVVPSPIQDSERIRKAIQGLGTDEKGLIWILGRRNASQRRKIRDTYRQLYNESLIDRLDSELSGDFGKAMILWTYDPAERDAKLAKDALKMNKKSNKDLRVIAEIACASSPHHLIAVRQAYCSLFECSLEEDIALTVSLPLRKLLVSLVSSYRYDKEKVDLGVASSEAAKLREAVNAKQLDNDNAVSILSTRNFLQLRATFNCYKQNYGSSLEQDIKSFGKGDLPSMLRVIVTCIESPEKHFAKVVRDAIIGVGTDEDSLTRVIVSRAEIDMMKIRGEYFNIYKSSLNNAVIGDTSGDYKAFLMTLLGAKV